jgi:hypothetical protein
LKPPGDQNSGKTVAGDGKAPTDPKIGSGDLYRKLTIISVTGDAPTRQAPHDQTDRDACIGKPAIGKSAFRLCDVK